MTTTCRAFPDQHGVMEDQHFDEEDEGSLEDINWDDDEADEIADGNLMNDSNASVLCVKKTIKLALFRISLMTGRVVDMHSTSSTGPVLAHSSAGKTVLPDKPFVDESDNSTRRVSPAASKWTPGTGYGDSTSASFDINVAVTAKKMTDASLAQEFVRVCESLETCPESEDLTALVSESVLIPAMITVLRQDSMVEAEQYPSALLAVLRLCTVLSLRADMGFLGYYESSKGVSLFSALSSLQKTAESAHKLLSGSAADDNGIVAEILEAARTTLMACPQVERQESTDETPLLEPAEETDQEASPEYLLDSVAARHYEAVMSGMCFEMVDGFSSHCFPSSGKAPRDVMLRLSKELASLSTCLPVTHESGVLVRSNQADLRQARVMVLPCADTPYANGAFTFDVGFPNDYPLSPPRMQLLTTGGGTVRFNPNLYDCGKVCLSLLGTWQGNSAENWNPSTSTFLQVVVSIQSLIFVSNPYFNEPGYEIQLGTAEGIANSKRYNVMLLPGTVRWAMLEVLRAPPQGFERSVRTHMFLKKEIVKRQINAWAIDSALRKDMLLALDRLQMPL